MSVAQCLVIGRVPEQIILLAVDRLDVVNVRGRG